MSRSEQVASKKSKILCNKCHKSYSYSYFNKHVCKNSGDQLKKNNTQMQVAVSVDVHEKLKTICIGCGKSFVCINRHKCKGNSLIYKRYGRK